MGNRSISRNIGIYTYTQFLVRQALPDGRIICVYCGEELTVKTRTLDHVNNDPTDNRPENLVAACGTCNHEAGSHDDEGWTRLAERVQQCGLDPLEMRARLEEVIRLPLPEKSDERVQVLAWGWFRDRIIYQRKIAAIRRGGDPKDVSQEPLPLPDDSDAETPF